MRYLILSDIHSNWEACEAVLKHARGEYERILCCGDLVGYGADPNRVVNWVRENVSVVVRGNHDKACAGMEDLGWFNPVARAAALWTEAQLTPENHHYLRTLPRGPVPVEDFQILHGSPVDEDEYLLTPSSAAEAAPYLDAEVSFFGHTHLQGGFFCHRNGVKRLAGPAPNEGRLVMPLERNLLYLINPGSVGQPRDGDARAGCALYDSEARLVEYRRVAYNVAVAQAKIRRAGLPDLLAERLAVGT